MNNYLEIKFSAADPDTAAIIIAKLSELGYEGFEEEEKFVKAFIREEDFKDNELENLEEELHTDCLVSRIENQNWNSSWESNFPPVVIDDFCAIRAEFHDPIPNVQHEIVITPKMSFGTGHHATTEMMVRMMREIDFKNKTVFDFGTGTGILAILAKKLGAEKVVAIDNDEWSIENAGENIAANNCDVIELLKASSPVGDKIYDVILCNIIKTVIRENFSALVTLLKHDGIILLSGLLKDDKVEILEEAMKHEFQLKGESEKGNWICLKLQR